MRPVLVEAGDVGIYGENLPPFVLRPSLRNIATLGTPVEIVAMFARVMGPIDPADVWGAIMDARIVLWACAEGAVDKAHLVLGSGFENGALAADQVVALARHMLINGVVGPLSPDAAPSTSPLEEFEASTFASLAVAHLGTSVEDAWDMSMTSLVQALKAKFPDLGKPAHGGPSRKELDATMQWFENVQRGRKNG